MYCWLIIFRISRLGRLLLSVIKLQWTESSSPNIRSINGILNPLKCVRVKRGQHMLRFMCYAAYFKVVSFSLIPDSH